MKGILIELIQKNSEHLDLNLNNALKRLFDTDRARYYKSVEKLREIRNFAKVKSELSKRKGA